MMPGAASQSFALELEYEHTHGSFHNQICVVDYDTKWIDIFAMVKCHLDVEGDIETKYVDDENDEVSVNTEEEYSQAKEIASKSGDTLRLRVYKLNYWNDPPGTKKEKDIPPRSSKPESRYDSVTGSALANADELDGAVRSTNKLAYISFSESTMADSAKRPPDKFVDAIVQDILQGLDGSVVVEEDTEEVRATHRKIRQGIKDKNHSSNIEWSSSSIRVPATKAPNEEFVNQVVQGVLAGLNGAEIRTAMMEKEKSEPVYHPHVVCDRCDQKIFGVRYKCAHCPDFDLCERCEPLPGHNESHVFLKMKKPALWELGRQHDGQLMPLLENPVYCGDEERIASWQEKKAKHPEARVKQTREEQPHSQAPPRPLPPGKRQRVEETGSDVESPVRVPVAARSRDLITKERNAALVNDVNFPRGTHFQPGSRFTKMWKVRNTGQVPFFAEGRLLKLDRLHGQVVRAPVLQPGDQGFGSLLDHTRNFKTSISPGEEGTVLVECTAPERPGVYQGTWRLVDESGREFGDRLTCEIVVDKHEVLEPKEDDITKIKEQVFCVQNEDTLEASDAVANLQPDQSDTSAPNKIISNNTELLTAHDILSFEMLKISKKETSGGNAEDENDVECEVKGVATPNNTPCGMTPCMSPVPQLDAECLSSKMSTHGAEINERVEASERTEEQTSTASSDDLIIVNGEEEADSSDDSSEEGSDSLLDDFYVVPLPDCFDLDKPLEECVLSNSTILTIEDTQLQEPTREPSQDAILEEAPQETPPQETITQEATPDVDTLLATSHTLVQTPMVPLVAATAIQPPDEVDHHLIVSSHSGTWTAPEIVLDVNEDESPEGGFVVSPDEDAVLPEGQSLVRQVLSSEDVEVTEEQHETEDNNKGTLVEEPPCVEERATTGVYRETDVDGPEEYHDAEDRKREEINTPQEEGDEIPRCGESDETSPSGPRAYGLPETQDQAREILGYTASRAVSVASSVMKQAYDVANNVAAALLVPPPSAQPMPPPSRSELFAHRAPMDVLIEMGFANRDKNRALLYKHNNDVNACVQELLSEEVDNWHLSRH